MNWQLGDMNERSLTRWVLWGMAVVVVIFLGIFIYHYQGNIQRTQAATKVISDLYLDENHNFLNPEINDEMIAQAYSEVTTIQGLQSKYLEELVEDVEVKYQAAQELSTLFQDDELIIKGNHISTGKPLKKEVKPSDVERLKNSIPPKEDSFYQALRHEYEQIGQVFDELSTVSRTIETLPTDINVMSLEDDINSFQAVETELEAIMQHPQSGEAMAALEQKGAGFAEKLIHHTDKLESESELVEEIFSTKSLALPLTGSEIDPRPLVALTFDDGPCENTLEILKILDEYNIKATFFQLGKYVEIYPEITKQVHIAGHEIGNHSYSHANFDNLSAEAIMAEIDITQDLITDVTGEVPTQYRTPYGNGRQQMIKLYPELYPVFWNVDSEDWISQDQDATVDHILETIQHRSIILMHDSQLSTTGAIKKLIPELIEKGYVFVSPEQIPEADNYRL